MIFYWSKIFYEIDLDSIEMDVANIDLLNLLISSIDFYWSNWWYDVSAFHTGIYHH